MERYGPPRRVSSEYLLWKDNGPWKQIVVHSFGNFRTFPRLAQDIFEQTARYHGPMEQRDRLLEFDPTLKVGRQELTVTGESEEMNTLALNLADEVLRGSKTPTQARRAFALGLDLLDAGKHSPDAEHLAPNFQNPRRDRRS